MKKWLLSLSLSHSFLIDAHSWTTTLNHELFPHAASLALSHECSLSLSLSLSLSRSSERGQALVGAR